MAIKNAEMLKRLPDPVIFLAGNELDRDQVGGAAGTRGTPDNLRAHRGVGDPVEEYDVGQRRHVQPGAVARVDNSAPADDVLGQASSLGAACIIHKPFRPRQLLAAIERCLQQAGGRADNGAEAPVPDGPTK